MPWGPKDAEAHTRAASTPTLQRQWAHVANGVRDKALASGATEAAADARAVREANTVVEGGRRPTHAHPSKTGQR